MTIADVLATMEQESWKAKGNISEIQSASMYACQAFIKAVCCLCLRIFGVVLFVASSFARQASICISHVILNMVLLTTAPQRWEEEDL